MGAGPDVAAEARRLHRSPWLDRGARLGLVGYGVVHLIISVTAMQLAFGDQSAAASQQGAFSQLSQSPLGDAALVLVTVGLLGLVVWQLIEAAVGHRGEDGGKRVLKRVASVGKAVVYGVLAASAAQKVFTASSGKSTDSMTAQLMSAPGGQVLVGAVGVAIVAVGVYLAARGLTGRFTKDLDIQARSGRRREPIVLLGRVGYLGKGAALAAVGALFVVAAVQHQAKESGGLDVALHELLRQPFGVVLVVAVAVGVGCFGLYCLAWARHLDR